LRQLFDEGSCGASRAERNVWFDHDTFHVIQPYSFEFDLLDQEVNSARSSPLPVTSSGRHRQWFANPG
jgi:hypothetical protein